MSRPMSQYTSAADAYASTSIQQPNSNPNRNSSYYNEEQEEEDEEDWNVYDDFNNARPLSSTPSQLGQESQPEGYWDRRSQDGLTSNQNGNAIGDGNQSSNRQSRAISTKSIGNNGQQKLYSDNPNQRTSLIPSSSFGFDARNGDPRYSIYSQGGMTATGPNGNNRNSVYPYQDDGLNSPGYLEENQFNGNDSINHLSKNKDINSSGIELITVPALGQEYTEEEMRKMTRPHKRRTKAGNKGKKIKAGASKFAEGQWRICGWLSPRVAVFLAFVFFAALGITLYFVIPRVPTIGFLTVNPLIAVPDGSSMEVHHSPSNFSMDMDLQLRGDNRGGWIPSKASSMEIEVYDSNTNKKVGEGNLDNFSFPGRKRTPFKFPVHFKYQSLNATGDQTFDDFYKGCAPKYPHSPRPGLNLRVILTMNIQGLIGKKGSSTSFTTLECPFTLQPDQ